MFNVPRALHTLLAALTHPGCCLHCVQPKKGIGLTGAVLLLAALIAVTSCSKDPLKEYDDKIETDITPIREVFADDFPVGAAVEPFQLKKAEGALLRYHFSSLTAENAMKFKTIHPKEDQYKFEGADKIVDFANRYNMKVRGHTLVWHHPAEIAHWVFVGKDGSQKSREEILATLEDHINTVVKRYKGDVYAWDVVNEPMDVSEDDNMRRTMWYNRVGPDYVEKAFEMAHKADPDALLFLNEYDTYKAKKRDAMYEFVKSLKEKGVPIHGVGMQVHISNGQPTIESLAETIQKFRELDLQIHITELDISMYAHEYEDIDTPPESHKIHQAHRYQKIFKLARENKDVVTNVTFWGFHNGHTWLSSQKKDWPLPFDKEYQHTLAYEGIVQKELPPDQEVLVIGEPKVYEAPKGTPTVDAKIDDVWKRAPVTKTTVVTTGNEYPEGRVRVLWDTDALYVLAEIDDTDLSSNAPNDYENDSFEIFLDEDNGKTPDYESDDYQFRISYRNDLAVGGYGKKSMITTAAEEVDGGYIVEARIELQTVQGEPGRVMGIDFQVNQNDGSGTRTAIVKWNDPTNESWRSTEGWGTVKLVE